MAISQLLFSYAGSKWRLAKKYQRHFPRHRHFVDVFGGTGVMIARKPRSRIETYNDLDDLAYNVFAVIQNEEKRNDLLRLIEITPTSRRQYEICKEILDRPTEYDEVQRAWAFVTCGSLGYTGHPCIANSFVRADQQRRRLIALPPEIVRWCDRFGQVCLENRHWREIINLYDAADTFFFCDPPYLPGVLRSSKDAYDPELFIPIEPVCW